MTLARARGFKMVASAAKEGGKILPSVKNLNDIDNLANTATTGMQGGESIQNVRNNVLARRAKQDFGNKSIMDTITKSI